MVFVEWRGAGRKTCTKSASLIMFRKCIDTLGEGGDKGLCWLHGPGTAARV